MSRGLQPVYQLKCSCNEYPWGKSGSKSLSARLCAKQPGYAELGPKGTFEIDEGKSYAEMWMGTYPVLPSYVADTDEDLQDLLDKHAKELIGEQVISKFGHTKLPYLPKVLSIAKALPLQLHPNKDMASKLHEEDPDNFADPNHKPEIALALTDFEAFCGFKPLARIERLLKLKPLQQFVPSDASAFTNETLRQVVNKMLKASAETIKETVNALSSMSPGDLGATDAHISKLIPRLAEQYDETDNGIVVALVTMNFLTLKAGESIYVPADSIHAYLSGDIIECMARSDNVLNTGFCPRGERNSADLFCKCLTFSPHSVEETMLRPRKYDGGANGNTQIYAPPMSEFDMLQTRLDGGEKEVLKAVNGPSIAIVTEGSAKVQASGPTGEKTYNIQQGQVYFIAQGVEIALESSENLLMHTAVVH